MGAVVEWLKFRWRTRHWHRCACGERRIAPGTAVGMRHSEETCFLCDALWQEGGAMTTHTAAVVEEETRCR